MEMEKLKKIIAEVLSIDAEDISAEMSFVDDLGADSLEIYQIIMGIEEEFDIAIEEDMAEQIHTVKQAYTAIRDYSEE
ncbi:MAG: acyl carrier protein [Butyribacter sp.]|nr:acyl carrier protein [bacterium]MDY3855342.1 acyl carrier protein [Butyribacter sp.]